MPKKSTKLLPKCSETMLVDIYDLADEDAGWRASVSETSRTRYLFSKPGAYFPPAAGVKGSELSPIVHMGVGANMDSLNTCVNMKTFRN